MSGADLTSAAVQKLLDVGAATAEPARFEAGARGALAAVVPDGYQLAVREYDVPGDRPRRRQGSVTVEDVASFAAYWLKHANADSEVYAAVSDTAAGRIIGVINASGGSDALAGHADHRVVLNLQATVEWSRWIGQNGTLLPQMAFAELIEAGASQIIDPTPGEMLDVAQGLTGRTKVEWQSGVRLSDGTVNLAYTEQTEAQVRGGLEIPAEFRLRLRPWKATVLGVEVQARLRYRIESGKASLGYVLVDLDKHVEGARLRLLGEVADALKTSPDRELTIYAGTP